MGRSGRPVHQDGEDHYPAAAGQARRPADDRDRPGERLPDRRTVMRDPRPPSSSPSGLRLPRRTARLRLTLLYGGTCLVFGAILLAVFSLLTWGAATRPA